MFKGMFERHGGVLYPDAKPAPPPPKEESSSSSEDENSRFMRHGDDEFGKGKDFQRIDVKKLREEAAKKPSAEGLGEHVGCGRKA